MKNSDEFKITPAPGGETFFLKPRLLGGAYSCFSIIGRLRGKKFEENYHREATILFKIVFYVSHFLKSNVPIRYVLSK